MSKPTPRFQHDCQCCTYLGQHGDGMLFPHADLYHCTQGGQGNDTVIARYSGDGPDYASGLYFGRYGLNPALHAAYVRARDAGLTD